MPISAPSPPLLRTEEPVLGPLEPGSITTYSQKANRRCIVYCLRLAMLQIWESAKLLAALTGSPNNSCQSRMEF